MRVVLTSDYLISPAYCEKEEISSIVSDLTTFSKLIKKNISISPLLESNALEQLIDSGNFPSVKKISENVVKCASAELVYTPLDITATINNILQKGLAYDDFIDILYDSEDIKVNQEVKSSIIIEQERVEKLKSLVCDVAIYNATLNSNISIFHYYKSSLSNYHVNVFGVVSELYSEKYSLDFKPYNLTSQNVSIYGSLVFYYLSLNVDEIVNNNSIFDEYILKLIVFIKALKIVQEKNGKFSDVKWGGFGFGSKFINSLINNQSMPNGAYFNVVVEALSRIVALEPKCEIKEFRLEALPHSKKGSSPLRTHLTSSGCALRLMLWKDSAGIIEFANIGNKFELKIEV